MKMHAKPKILLAGLSIFFIAAMSCSLAQGTVQVGESQVLTTLADKDTGVMSTQPTTNFGHDTSISAGYPNVEPFVNAEAIFHFDLADKPANLISAVVRLFIMVADAGHIRVTAVDGAWDEYTVTWNTKPSGSAFITDLDLTTDPAYRYIDITNFLSGRNDITIRLNATSTAEFVSITVVTREEEMNQVYRPVIIWTYTTSSGSPSVDGYATAAVLLAMVTGIVAGTRKIKDMNKQ